MDARRDEVSDAGEGFQRREAVKAFSKVFQRSARKIRIDRRADDERTDIGKLLEKINIKAIF